MAYLKNAVSLYISAAPELTRERGVLGHAITTIPTTLGWTITYTPASGEALNVEAVARANAHLLVLGSDIKAPVGFEWQIARRAGRLPRLFLRDTLHTLAADAFARELSQHAPWHRYADADDLRRQVLKWLGAYLIEHALSFGLPVTEIEQLRTWQAELEKTAPSPAGESPRETAHSGVVLSPERFVPREGRIVD